MNLDEALQTFIAESRELLEEMENALLNVDLAGDQDEAINAIFRAAHTIKGSAGLFSLDHMVGFTHVVESLLDKVRDGSVKLNDEMVVLLLSCCDYLTGMVNGLVAGQHEQDPDTAPEGEMLKQQLQRHMDGEGAAAIPSMPVLHAEPDVERIDKERLEQLSSDYWHISLRFGRIVLQNGMDPIAFLRYLSKLGRIVGIATIPDALPPAEDMDAELCYLGFEIAFDSTADRDAIAGVFEFVQEDCEIRIIPPHSKVSEYVNLIRALPEQAARLGEILIRCGSVTQQELDGALHQQSHQDEDAPAQQLGSILVGAGNVPPVVVEAALAKQKQVSEQKAQESRSIRVDSDKLDKLIDLVGELIIAGARASMIGQHIQNTELLECTSTLTGLVEDVRDAALELRMVKIGATFNRFQRVVHDVARELGKDIGLIVDGEDSELDKTVVEKIGDPLMHLVRNAMDHGIEPAEVRIAAGKSAKGMIKLNAFHESGSIVIEVSDDGGGLRKEKILAKAIERGLVDPERKLTDSEIYNLIFEAGFSTAEKITNLSGRGVGMDVVKRNIQALRGSVDVGSREGQGTTVTVRLPLTLAIIDGFLVQVGSSVFVVPLDMIEECIEYATEPGQDYTNLRGQVLPLVRLRELFRIDGVATRRESIVVLKFGTHRAGLVVDTLLGEFQTVIKPLSPMFSEVKCISGSTILGSGEVALILDVAALMNTVGGKGAVALAA
ncbi:two-component system, chemotaxis family, sensor kinase CheA [Duganella sp. CF402]|uniref:chemotaxis protein CheA n=1 Tax=unclassified Duganella TaxID=2636909 RepID=UPI0008C1ECB2|nr:MULTISPECIES: chemotaxis protein CheA [unclassified Duganella]RZT05938.1 two-component system chemotaxis sensor kinase CheA [Duganella sp. BK701]SEN16357.1 two-component system, chemotaxis family, sensor kinase CheA [Duganella sp. CF402]